MKKSLIALALAAAFAVPAFAQTSSSDATGAPPAAEPAGPHTLTGNMTIATSYRFRGIDQTFGKPALQGGIDYSHESGIYVGNWNSNVSSGAGFAEGNLEMDFYGGWKTTFAEDFGLDLGGIYYYYPGSNAGPLSYTNSKDLGGSSSGTVHNGELYIGASWKFVSLKYSYAVTDYFSLPDSKGTGYLDLKIVPELHNAVKVLLFLDVGGSMDDHIRMVEELFSAARTEFKNLEHFYFHNCVYESVWKDNHRRSRERIPTVDVMRKFGHDYKAIFVGDAAMSPYELEQAGGSVEHWNDEPGRLWLERLLRAWPRAAWLNPAPEEHWGWTASTENIRRIFDGRMVPVTLSGIEGAMKSLS